MTRWQLGSGGGQMGSSTDGKESIEPIWIRYTFTFPDGEVTTIEPRLDPYTLALINGNQEAPPEWATLGSVACSVCEISEHPTAACPVAANLAELVRRFSHRFSYEKVSVRVETEERTVLAETTIQHGLASLTGIYMVSVGCPVLSRLRPMVRFHLPFASLQETIYRATSMYLLGQYMRGQRELNADWSLVGLEEIYASVHRVNVAIAKRIREAATHDANANALVRLDLFTDGVAFSIKDALKDLEYLFKGTYLD